MSDPMPAVLALHRQTHLLRHADTLPEETKARFFTELSAIDFPLLSRAYSAVYDPLPATGTVSPLPVTDTAALTASARAAYIETGESLIRAGSVAVVSMAGGQGSRLGFSGPKGCYTLLPGRSLFSLTAERIAALQRHTGGCVPWYIMTGPDNDAETRKHFADHRNFGLHSVQFFMQGKLPALNFDGRILLSAPGLPAFAPDGNGGVFRALRTSGMLAHMDDSGIRYVFFCGVDNALVRPADPLFVGLTAESGAPLSSKSVVKTDPEERVGVFCLRDGHPGVIEYTELPEALRYAAAPDGSLLYGDANIVTHLFTLDALHTVCSAELPIHTARKAVPFLREDGVLVHPEEPNAYKFELFIFDAFAMLPRMLTVRVSREHEFAPVKNAVGADSPETARALLRAAGM